MKRAIAALAGAAALLAAAPAHATAPADPVKVLQKRLAKGTGLKFTDTISYIDLEGTTAALRRTGKLTLDRKGAAAVEVRARTVKNDADHLGGIVDDERVIAVGKRTYVKGGILSRSAPEGKTWVKLPRASLGLGGRYSQTINPAEPATLKALITSGEKSGRTYTGKISEAELWKISSWFRLSKVIKPTDPEVLEYRLTLSAGELPQRLVTTFPAASGPWRRSHNGGETISVDTRYTGWGSKVRISAPARSQVHEVKR
ncbi:hypothetical protein [Nonomuraea harbinensis]|uniref:DUF2092 domain-containing protein n=1 Tax=Nonomuraea harbinensis TaxID=1286938 RepID=A0ABW1BXI9_9ACTN|nr:hypothetical protein [Nonomuraea harbinensis]